MPRRRSLAVLRHRNHRGAARQGPLHHHRPHRHRADGRGRRPTVRPHTARRQRPHCRRRRRGRRGRGRRRGRRHAPPRLPQADLPLGRRRRAPRLRLSARRVRAPARQLVPNSRPPRASRAPRRRAGRLCAARRLSAHRLRPLFRRGVRRGDPRRGAAQPAGGLHGDRLHRVQLRVCPKGAPVPRFGHRLVWPRLPPLLHLHGHHDGPGRAVAQPLRLHPPLWRPFALDHRRLPPGRPAGRSARRVLQPLLDGLSHSGRRHARPRTDGRAALLVGPRLCSLHRRARRVQPSRRPAPLQGCHRDRQRVQHRVQPRGGAKDWLRPADPQPRQREELVAR
mmetsp:Transcript_49079/g.163851  ORF Transcript_49079/g.163851 Transcript_49079/m.163851 type:complete len:337 (+) Transcript_49079:714-1724(+)